MQREGLGECTWASQWQPPTSAIGTSAILLVCALSAACGSQPTEPVAETSIAGTYVGSFVSTEPGGQELDGMLELVLWEVDGSLTGAWEVSGTITAPGHGSLSTSWGGGLSGTVPAGDDISLQAHLAASFCPGDVVPFAVHHDSEARSLTLDGALDVRTSQCNTLTSYPVSIELMEGDIDLVDRVDVVDPPEADVRFASITAGEEHTCALDDGGAAYCWGSNNDGQLGIGRAFVPGPTQRVAGGLTFTQIAAGGSHTCAITATGVAYCWGANSDGQLGTGTQEPSETPVRVNTMIGFTSISAGQGHSCAVSPSRGMHCWGFNGNGELGDGTLEDSNVPVQVTGGVTLESVALSSHSCGLTPGGDAYCWGSGNSGQLGGATGEVTSPSPVMGDLTFETIAPGSLHSCALTTVGDPYCWGGEFGPDPFSVAPGSGFEALAGSRNHDCALTVDGVGYCWGDNDWAQFGDGTRTSSGTPTAISGGLRFTSLAVAYRHSCGVTQDGAAYCWGVNQYGRLGNSEVESMTTVPVRVTAGVN